MTKTTLIIENELVICDDLEALFINDGWHVYKAYGLVEALNVLIQAECIDLILLDIMMETIPDSSTVARNAGIVAVDYFYDKLKKAKKRFPQIIAFTAVTEVIPVAEAHRLIRKVINKNSSGWEEQLLYEAHRAIGA